MTETEWLTTTDSYAMLDSLATADPRKLRQFAAEALLRSLPSETPTKYRTVVETYQRYIDGDASPDEWFETYSAVAAGAILGGIQDLIAPEPFEAARRAAGFSFAPLPTYFGRRRIVGPVDRLAETALLREIFGNPFRPVAFSPEWRTDTAVTLARTVCDLRQFDAMPILADALQDAGCDRDDILSHCRDTSQMHVRGCWVTDLVLNRS
jgi:hypothetical protein